MLVCLRVDFKNKMKRIVLILGNWAIHNSKRTLSYLNDMGWNIIFVSPYSPEYFPIELFINNLKRRVSVHSRGNHTKLYSDSGGRLMKKMTSNIFQKWDLILLDKSNSYNKSSI